MKIAAVDETPHDALALQTSLLSAGFEVPFVLCNDELMKSHGAGAADDHRIAVDAVVLRTRTLPIGLLDATTRFALAARAALAIFTEDRDIAKIRYAMQIGVGAYVIDGFDPERLGAVIDVARARFDALSTMYKKIEKLETALLERKIVERAKGLVMKRRSCDEQTAYRAIQKAAMDRNLKMVDVARQVLNVSDLVHR